MNPCPRCNGQLIRDDDPFDGPRLLCLQCGRSPRIKPLGEYYLRAELEATEKFYPQKAGSPVPPTRVYE